MTLRQLIESYCPGRPDPKKGLHPYLIAEAGVNHEGDMDIARRLIEEAKEGGADAIKFQTYRAETIASRNSPSYWDLSKEPTNSQYQLFKKYDKFWKTEFETLKRHCDQVGIEFISTPFDVESAKFLNDLMDVFKISSSDLNNKPFIDILCSYEKPIILSTGASWMWEVEQAVGWIQAHGNSLALLHCVLNYPTADENANLSMIPELIRKFPEHIVGYSDHTLPKDMKTLEIAAMLRARIIEKHFTHDKTLSGNDHYHAMDKVDVQRFQQRVDNLNMLLGDRRKRPIESESLSRANARRSIVLARDVDAGYKLAAEDLTYKRPGTGVSPLHIEEVIGRTAVRVLKADSILQWKDIQ